MISLSVIIPLYNEEDYIIELLKRVHAVDVNKEVIIVDDKSTDQSCSLVENYIKDYPEMKLVKKNYNSGRSKSIIEGIKHAKGQIVITQDADLEYDPQDYKKIIEPILKNKTQVVFGSRVLGIDGYPVNRFYWLFGLKLLNFIQNTLFGTKYTDSCSCYVAMKKETWDSLDFSKIRNFTLNPTITSQLAKNRINVIEIPISYKPRKWEEGKKVKLFRDGREHITTLLNEKFSRN